MDFIYLLTGLCTVAFAIAGLALTCYLERRWLSSRKPKSTKPTTPGLGADGFPT